MIQGMPGSTAACALLAQLDREMWVVTARAGPARGGLIATFVSQASIVPALPRVLVGLARHHYTWELVEASGAFALHMLSEAQLQWAWHFGFQSGRHLDKLAGLACHEGKTGSPILADAAGWLDCRVEARLETGDRTVYLAEVIDAQQASSSPPLTFKQFLEQTPPDRLQQMKDLLAHDSDVDAAAILAWRQQSSRKAPRTGNDK